MLYLLSYTRRCFHVWCFPSVGEATAGEEKGSGACDDGRSINTGGDCDHDVGPGRHFDFSEVASDIHRTPDPCAAQVMTSQ